MHHVAIGRIAASVALTLGGLAAVACAENSPTSVAEIAGTYTLVSINDNALPEPRTPGDNSEIVIASTLELQPNGQYALSFNLEGMVSEFATGMYSRTGAVLAFTTAGSSANLFGYENFSTTHSVENGTHVILVAAHLPSNDHVVLRYERQ